MSDLKADSSPVARARLADANLEYFKVMYQDRIDRISETKKFMNELVRWSVTLNMIVLAFFISLNDESRSLLFLTVPIFILLVSFVLFISLEADLQRHRAALGRLRKIAGGIVWQLHESSAEEHASGNWRPEFANAYSSIILAGSIGTGVMIVCAKLFDLSVVKAS